MSPWHDVLIFHLRNGGFYEQTQTLLLPFSPLFPFGLGVVLWSISHRRSQKVEGTETEEDSCPLLLVHRRSCGNENVVRGKEDFPHQGNAAIADIFKFICMLVIDGEKVSWGHQNDRTLNFHCVLSRCIQKGHVWSTLPGFAYEDNNFLTIEVIMVVTHELLCIWVL